MSFPIQLVAVGRLKKDSDYLQVGIAEYLKRLRPYARVSIVEVADEPISPTRTREQVIEAEGQRILSQMEKAGYTIALSERGQCLSSEALAHSLDQRGILQGNPLNGGMPTGRPGPIIVIVGGPLGLSQTVIDRADWVLSLSPLTFPHQLVRLLILEQLYRAFKIQRNEPYHK